MLFKAAISGSVALRFRTGGIVAFHATLVKRELLNESYISYSVCVHFEGKFPSGCIDRMPGLARNPGIRNHAQDIGWIWQSLSLLSSFAADWRPGSIDHVKEHLKNP